jgi:phage tail-like protein
MLNDQSLIGLANRFHVKVIEQSTYDLGSWQKCDGLDVSWDVPEYRTGDGGNERWFFPANTKYKTVKLVRAATANESEKVRQWLEANSWKQSTTRGLITITLFDSSGTKVIDWELRYAMPKSWSINSMDAGASQLAIETLEIDHGGFLNDFLDYSGAGYATYNTPPA